MRIIPTLLLSTIGLLTATLSVSAAPGGFTTDMANSTLTRNADLSLTLTVSTGSTQTVATTVQTNLSGVTTQSQTGITLAQTGIIVTQPVIASPVIMDRVRVSTRRATTQLLDIENSPMNTPEGAQTQTQASAPEKSEEDYLLDLKSTQIGSYRKNLLKSAGVQYANPVYSVRVRAQATKQSKTVEYLIKNDEVTLVNTGSSAGWQQVTTTEKQQTGHIAAKYLRAPNMTDLVRKKQADQAYWSDIGHVRVASKVNVRNDPVYGSKIIAVFDNTTPLYILDEVNGWSEILTEDGTHGYIKSQYIVTTKVQKEDWLKGVR